MLESSGGDTRRLSYGPVQKQNKKQRMINIPKFKKKLFKLFKLFILSYLKTLTVKRTKFGKSKPCYSNTVTATSSQT